MMPNPSKSKSVSSIMQGRAKASLASLFVGDALAMPVHWFYNPEDIERAFTGGIRRLEAAPEVHPSSIMSLHSTRRGGRAAREKGGDSREVVGEMILKGRGHLWGQANRHYHHGMQAGDNTLNAHCARVLIRSIITNAGAYDPDRYLDAYIKFMTADPPRHPDTYAESYHRGFFANLDAGKPPTQCGAHTHDSPSIGGLISIGPLAIHQLLQDETMERVQATCRKHLFLTHPDETLGRICDGYVKLIADLLSRETKQDPREYLATAARTTMDIDLKQLVAGALSDREVVGRKYSTACYISDSWPSILYLAYKYMEDLQTALIANTNLGGDNVHRGAVLGGIIGLAQGHTVDQWFEKLADYRRIKEEIAALLHFDF